MKQRLAARVEQLSRALKEMVGHQAAAILQDSGESDHSSCEFHSPSQRVRSYLHKLEASSDPAALTGLLSLRKEMSVKRTTRGNNSRCTPSRSSERHDWNNRTASRVAKSTAASGHNVPGSLLLAGRLTQPFKKLESTERLENGVALHTT